MALGVYGATHFPTDEEKLLVWKRREGVSQRLRDPYESQWIKNWKSYRAFKEEMQDPRDWWRSNEFIPETFNAIETLLPRDILGMFSRPEWFDVNCPHGGVPGHPGLTCFDYERMVKSLLLSGASRMNLFQPVYEGRKYGSIMGHVWWKLPWERQTGFRPMDVPDVDPNTGELAGIGTQLIPIVEYDDPKLDWVSNFKLWPDPTGQGEWFIEQVDTTLEKLQRINRDFGIYKNLEELETQPVDYAKNRNSPQGTSSYANRSTEMDAIEGYSPDVRDEGYEGTPVCLKICVGKVPYEPEDGVIWRRFVYANDNTVIRDTWNPTPDLKPEYFGSAQIPIPGFVYGDSVVRYAEPLNNQLNRIENFRMDEVLLSIWQQYVANRNAVSSQQLEFAPGGVIFVDTAADVRTAFAVLERRPVLPEAYRESAVKADQIQRTTGATATQQGSVPETQDRSATAFAGRVQLGNERFRLATMYQNMTFKRQLLKRMFALYQRNLPQDRLIRIVGTDYRCPIDISMLQDDVDINIDADIYDIDTVSKQQAMAAFLQAAQSPAFAQWWRVDDLLRDAVEITLHKNGRKYVKSAEEVAAESQAQIFAAMQLQSFQATQQAQLDIATSREGSAGGGSQSSASRGRAASG